MDRLEAKMFSAILKVNQNFLTSLPDKLFLKKDDHSEALIIDPDIFVKEILFSKDKTIDTWNKFMFAFKNNEGPLTKLKITFRDDHLNFSTPRIKVNTLFMNNMDIINFKPYNVDIGCLSFRQSIIRNMIIDNGKIDELNFQKSIWDKGKIINVAVNNLIADYSKMTGIKWKLLDCQNIKISNATLTGELENSTIKGGNFYKAKLNNLILDDLIMSSVTFAKSSFDNLEMCEGEFNLVDFDDCYIINSDDQIGDYPNVRIAFCRFDMSPSLEKILKPMSDAYSEYFMNMLKECAKESQRVNTVQWELDEDVNF